jgi:predicted RNase H-like nuclease
MTAGQCGLIFLPSITAISALQPDFLVIDIPIGLADCGTREADRLARALLGTRGCCVFSAPLRGMLACNTHREACAVGQRIHGKGITIQTWGIVPKIREVDNYLTPAEQSRIREGHPEVSFAMMNGGQAVVERKSTSAGRDARLRLLEAHFPGVRCEVEKHRALRADVIDAFALLWTARRVRDGIARALPASAVYESRGLAMQIWT